MASIRRLPSGLYQATVRLPGGKRITRTDKLKRVVQDWATQQEAEIARGVWKDPRAGKITVQEWRDIWWPARVMEGETRRINERALRLRIIPRWGDVPLGKIRRIHVQEWIRQMEHDGVGAVSVHKAYAAFNRMLRDAALEGLLGENPCQKIELPRLARRLPNWFTREQVDAIKAELPAGHAVMTELMVASGPRWGEAAAAVGRERPDGRGNVMDWQRRRLRIRGTLTQDGQWKDYPKTAASRREVPVPQDVCEDAAALLAGRPPDSWIFVARRRTPGGGELPTLQAANWRRVWYAAIDRANRRIAREDRGLPAAERRDPVPRYRPHDCRHTAASWLVQDGVPLYHVQALLGHESSATTERYSHLGPRAHETVEDAWRRIRAHQRRTARPAG